MISRAHEDDHDDELTLAAILLLLARQHPDMASVYAQFAADAAHDAKLAVQKLTGDLAKGVEAAASKADVAYHAALLEGEEAAKRAFAEAFQEQLTKTMETFGVAGETDLVTRIDQIVSQEVLGAWNDANHVTIFGPGSDATHWRFNSEGDKKVCPFCVKLAGKIFSVDDEIAGHLLPADHFGDRCWTSAVTRRVMADEVSDGADFEAPEPEFDYDKRSGYGLASTTVAA